MGILQGGIDGTLAMGWGSGTAWFPYLISVSNNVIQKSLFIPTICTDQPYEAIQRRAIEDHTSVSWTFNDYPAQNAATLAVQKSVAIVFLNSDSGEDYITVDGNEGDR